MEPRASLCRAVEQPARRRVSGIPAAPLPLSMSEASSPNHCVAKGAQCLLSACCPSEDH